MSAREAPAQISAALSALFPGGVVCAELTGSGNPVDLLPAEAPYVERAVSTRREEFAAGRACARLALRELGVSEFPIHMAEDRRPVWPPDIVGSITHTRGFCAAAVAKHQHQRAIGIDTERAASVKPQLWPRICGPEFEWLQALPEAQRQAAATLIFCIKEAFYKCQYTLTREYLGFGDVRVEVSDWPGGEGRFAVHPCKTLILSQHMMLPVTGRYRSHQEFVTAAAAVPQ